MISTSKFSNVKISTKLWVINITLCLAFALIVMLFLFSLYYSEKLITQIVEQNVRQISANSRITRELSRTFSDINLLINTFYGKDDYLQSEGKKILANMYGLMGKSADPSLKEAMDEMTGKLGFLLHQCGVVNTTLARQDSLFNRIENGLADLEKHISGRIIERTLQGKDVSILEQMAVLTAGYRETLLEAIKVHSESWPDHYYLDFDQTDHPVVEHLEELILRMQTLTAADTKTVSMAREIIQDLEQYKGEFNKLHSRMRELQARRNTFEASRSKLIAVTGRIDEDMAQSSSQVAERVKKTFFTTGTIILLLSISFLLILAFVTVSFFIRNIRRPMELLRNGVERMKRGDLDTGIDLERQDEWKLVESALNDMAGNLSQSYFDLQDKNIELENARTQLEEKITELEREITARRQAENALRASEEKYRSIFENAVEGIFQTTKEGRILSANPAFAAIFGYESPEEMIQNVRDLKHQIYVHPESRDEFIRQALEYGIVAGFEAEYLRKDGEHVWGSLHARPVYGDSGDLLYIEGIFQDITARKKAEQEKAVLEEQLRQSQKMEAVGNLAGGIAHDFNNLLHAISGYLQLLLMKKEEEDPDFKYLSEIKKATQRATDIAQRLLTFSRKIEAKPKVVNLNDIVTGTLKILEHTLPKMISMETNLAPDIYEIDADPTQLDQVLMNLASNAADAMPEGGQLIIETENIELDSTYRSKHLEVEPGAYVVLKVTDNGVGMDRETVEHIFDPFYTTKDVGKGTGLGLSIVYGIIKGHKGYINCYSEPGVGTTFKIYLPATRDGEKENGHGESKPRMGRMEGTETILVVDDEEMIREIAEEMLEAYGYEVIKAGSGEETLDIYRENTEGIDLILLDLGMPGMGGEKCLAELRKFDPEVKIVVASGYAAHKIAKNPVEYGAAGFVSKPYPLKEMLWTIRDVLDRKQE